MPNVAVRQIRGAVGETAEIEEFRTTRDGEYFGMLKKLVIQPYPRHENTPKVESGTVDGDSLLTRQVEPSTPNLEGAAVPIPFLCASNASASQADTHSIRLL